VDGVGRARGEDRVGRLRDDRQPLEGHRGQPSELLARGVGDREQPRRPADGDRLLRPPGRARDARREQGRAEPRDVRVVQADDRGRPRDRDVRDERREQERVVAPAPDRGREPDEVERGAGRVGPQAGRAAAAQRHRVDLRSPRQRHRRRCPRVDVEDVAGLAVELHEPREGVAGEAPIAVAVRQRHGVDAHAHVDPGH
jgi:hypothetical protein